MPLVAAFACPHTPQLLVRPPTEDRALVLRVHAALAELKRRLTAARPDVIALIAGDHIEGFFLNAVPALAVHVGARAAGEFGRYRYAFDVHEPLARAIVEQSIEAGWEFMGHGVRQGAMHLLPDQRAAIREAVETLTKFTGKKPKG